MSPDSPTVVYSAGPRTHRVRLSGDIDIAVEDQLLDVASQFAATGVGDVEIDVGDVTFMDSTGLAFLARIHVACAGRGGKMTLIGPNQKLTRLFELTGFLPRFTITPAD
jgi:anti-anti-sigma factor